jgi:hypothetical protein
MQDAVAQKRAPPLGFLAAAMVETGSPYRYLGLCLLGPY